MMRAHLPEGMQQSEDELVLALHVLGEALRGAAGQHVRLQLLHVLRQRWRRCLRSTNTRRPAQGWLPVIQADSV